MRTRQGTGSQQMPGDNNGDLADACNVLRMVPLHQHDSRQNGSTSILQACRGCNWAGCAIH